MIIIDSIKNETRITKKEYLRFYWFTLRKNIAAIFIFLIVIIGLIHMCIDNFEVSFAFIFAILIILFLTLVFLNIIYFTPNKEYKKKKETTNYYNFKSDRFEIDNHKPLVNSHAEYYYEAIHKAYEKADAFYIFIDKRRAFVVDKNSFTQGSADDLKSILLMRLGKKFKF